MLEWVEVVDPRWVQDLTEINKTQNYVHFTQQWWIQKGDKLGRGSSGKVRWVQRKQGSPAKPCAAKIIENRKLSAHQSREMEMQMWATEWHVFKIVSGNPNIVRLLDVYLGEDTPLEKGQLVFIMELCNRSDLSDFIEHYADVHISDATVWMLHMCTGLGHLHSHSIMHRDIKPGNCLLLHRPKLSPMLKLSDFGSAAILARKGDKGFRSVVVA